MTRETKIGLLVGLAFIIVIGILLSDHFTSATQPHQAALTTTIDGILGSTRTLGPQTQQPGPLDVPAVEPRSPILVQPEESLERREHVEVGGGRTGQRIIDVTQQPQIPADPIITQIPDVIDRGAASANANALESIFKPLEPAVIPLQPEPTLNASVRQYKAESGDTVSKMAQKFLGNKSKASIDLIIKANPALAANPNKIVIGETYNIPGAPRATTPVVAERPETSNTHVTTNNPPPAAASASVEYVAKQGDILSKIAKEQCGTASNAMITQILELNKDVLKGNPDRIKVGMKLKLPPKQLASR